MGAEIPLAPPARALCFNVRFFFFRSSILGAKKQEVIRPRKQKVRRSLCSDLNKENRTSGYEHHANGQLFEQSCEERNFLKVLNNGQADLCITYRCNKVSRYQPLCIIICAKSNATFHPLDS